MDTFRKHVELQEFLATPEEFYFTDDTKIPNNIDSIVEINGTTYHLNVAKSNFEKIYTVSFGRMVTKKVRLWSIRPKDIRIALSTFLKMMEATQAALGTKVDGYVIKVPASVDVAKYNKFLNLIIKKTYIQTFRPVTVQEVEEKKYPFKYLFLCRKAVHPSKIFSSKQFSQYSFDVKTSSIKGEALIPVEPKRIQKPTKSLNPAKNIDQLIAAAPINDLVAFAASDNFEKALNAKAKPMEKVAAEKPIPDKVYHKHDDYVKLTAFFTRFWQSISNGYSFGTKPPTIMTPTIIWAFMGLPNEKDAIDYKLVNMYELKIGVIKLHVFKALLIVLYGTNFHKYKMWSKDKFDLLYTVNVAIKYMKTFNPGIFLGGTVLEEYFMKVLIDAANNLEKLKKVDYLEYEHFNNLAKSEFPGAFDNIRKWANQYGIKESFFDLFKTKHANIDDVLVNINKSVNYNPNLTATGEYGIYDAKNKVVSELDMDFQFDHHPFEINEEMISNAYLFSDDKKIPLKYKGGSSKEKFKDEPAYRWFQLQNTPESRTLKDYTGGDYRAINRFLRDPEKGYESYSNQVEKCIKAFHMAPKIQQDVWVTRDAGIKPMEGNIPWPVEKIFFDPAVQSCSADLTFDWGFKENLDTSKDKGKGKCKLLIYVPKGSTAIPALDYSQHPHEREIILPPGSLYRPIKVFYSEKISKTASNPPQDYEITPIHIIICIYMGAALDYIHERVIKKEKIFQEGVMSMKDFLKEQRIIEAVKNSKKDEDDDFKKGAGTMPSPKEMESVIKKIKSGKINLQK